MDINRIRITLVRLAIVAGLPFLSGTAVSQEVKIVVPNGLENRDGNSSSGEIPYGYRQQFLVPFSQFDDVPPGKNFITQLAFRPDASVDSPRTSTVGDFQVRLSTTTAYTLSTIFAENVSNDELVFEGEFAWTRLGGPAGELKDFDYVIDFQSQFFYDPNQERNLLVDLFSTDPDATYVVDQENNSEVFRVAAFDDAATDAEATFGPSNQFMPVQQFTFVPEPSAATLFCLSFTCMLLWRRRRLFIL